MGVRDIRTLTKTKGGATGWGETQINMAKTDTKKTENTSREEGPREKQTNKKTTNMVDCRKMH